VISNHSGRAGEPSEAGPAATLAAWPTKNTKNSDQVKVASSVNVRLGSSVAGRLRPSEPSPMIGLAGCTRPEADVVPLQKPRRGAGTLCCAWPRRDRFIAHLDDRKW